MAEHFERRDSGVESLENRYRHLDDRVGRLGQEVAGISATLSQVSHTLETISRRVNEPQRTQWSAIIAACAFVASLGYSSLQPVKEGVAYNGARIREMDSTIHNFERTIGEFHATVAGQVKEHERIYTDIDLLRARAREADRASADLTAHFEGLEEKVREVDQLGSRKWISTQKQ